MQPESNPFAETPERVLTAAAADTPDAPSVPARKPAEFGGPPGPEPTRFGDWEKSGRCIDF